MGMRMMSKDSTSMVYHRPECRYARKIYKRNRVQMNWDEAEWKGYRPCKCCDGAAFIYKLELYNIECFAEQHNLDVDLKNNKIYVRTDVGCWKIVYNRNSYYYIGIMLVDVSALTKWIMLHTTVRETWQIPVAL